MTASSMQYSKAFNRTISREINSVGSFCKYTDDIQRVLFSLKEGSEILLLESSGGLGDVLAATSVIKGLAERYKNIAIVLVTKKSAFPLLQNNPYLRQFFSFSPGMDTFDYLLSFDVSFVCSEWESRAFPIINKTRAEILWDYFELPGNCCKPIYCVTEQEKEEANLFLESKKLKNKKLVGITLRSAALYKDYPIQKYREVVSLLQEKKDIHFLIFDETLPVFWPYKNYTNVCNQALRDVAALLEKCNCLITVDSGLLHLAIAVGTKLIFLYGISSLRARTHFVEAINITTDGLDCVPCWRGDRFKCKRDEENSDSIFSSCITAIEPQKIVEAINVLV